ncbi:hypothetical protein HanRHA438_Chr11g0509701 [Helianthus annuus]|uniref:Uncharacterized protein n=1 Tax=Helianthus annuus TaxID=4232 RepID=A0A9K3HQM5_HELAN|nr:hypothetical protein HanXRQr2_Chr11g0497091 [Helianthus annuus]KAJ0502022.1 hypothetical protein HanHA300_Chr11g0407781 [Helianthus annuus]KAJ0509975.1 hypothetical protein HanIR_Chr11g0535211 [Helianthus annuus]KAJ0517946.1 hypothetical protein HanHA89_Chr11g0431481 [Helianthus annuus]KAJ0685966.1 hypothetical protein HanLR1_Chr11g0409021 [Helianthus annuus]
MESVTEAMRSASVNHTTHDSMNVLRLLWCVSIQVRSSQHNTDSVSSLLSNFLGSHFIYRSNQWSLTEA